ncbi:hypothetical protein GCM10023191_024350 [Actinoallomurus oryzae]|uniref:Uncharacterized protein n=1 Tax=Actinoallomurus oryzae TaxID=502180 RepID=A0ABP8PPQ0_9ACTN
MRSAATCPGGSAADDRARRSELDERQAHLDGPDFAADRRGGHGDTLTRRSAGVEWIATRAFSGTETALSLRVRRRGSPSSAVFAANGPYLQR